MTLERGSIRTCCQNDPSGGGMTPERGFETGLEVRPPLRLKLSADCRELLEG